VERREELEAPCWQRVLLPRLGGGASPSLEFGGGVYGPVASRRLGRSLWLDTPPGFRVCSFGCVYCEYAADPREGVRWPTPGDIAAALNHALLGAEPLDSITLSGHGEPTLDPRIRLCGSR